MKTRVRFHPPGANSVQTDDTNRKIKYCESCGKLMSIKRGRFGPFLACTGYPACKNTRRLAEDERLGEQAQEPPGVTPPAGAQSSKLEEILKFSNLTQFRSSLLDVIPKLQENKFLRFVITKHGKPAAVIMSYDAYVLLKEAADLIIEQEAAKSPDVALRDAYERMTQTKLEPPAQANEIAARLGILAAEMKNLQNVISVADASVQEAPEEDTNEEHKLAR